METSKKELLEQRTTLDQHQRDHEQNMATIKAELAKVITHYLKNNSILTQKLNINSSVLLEMCKFAVLLVQETAIRLATWFNNGHC